jgi:predicted lipid-binding transport protein (Tim44 family)
LALPNNSGNQLPDGTEPAAFLRIARQRFNHIQSMNTASNISEIQRYLTPDLYQSMYQDIMANQDQDVAEFSNLMRWLRTLRQKMVNTWLAYVLLVQ